MKEKLVLKVSDYTTDPGPRYKRQDKPGEHTSGEEYYVTVLNSAFSACLKDDKNLVLCLDEVSGYPSSFLDEAIGELVYDFGCTEVECRLIFETVMFRRRVQQVMEETYKQWNARRDRGEIVVHSPGLTATLFRMNKDGEFVEYKIGN